MDSQTLLILLLVLVAVAVVLLAVLVLRQRGQTRNQSLVGDLEAERSRAQDAAMAAAQQLGRLEAIQGELESERTRASEIALHLSDARQRIEREVTQAADRDARLLERESDVLQLKQHLVELSSQIETHREAYQRLHGEHAQVSADLKHSRLAQEELRAYLDSAQEKLSGAFSELAGKVFDERGQQFEKNVRQATLQSRADIEVLLKPFSEKLGEFRQRVDAVYGEESRERASLLGAVGELKTLNQDMAVQTAALTNALKGNSRARGDWGEMILETVLKASGLEAGKHYKPQFHAKDEETGRNRRPDIVVSFPDNRQVAVDSKVNLVAWAAYNNAQTHEEQQEALLEHTAALRKHVNDLASKDYPKLIGTQSLDLTVLFVPIEGALAAALAANPTLQQEAWSKGIAFASPNTLMALLKVAERMWVRDQLQKQVGAIGQHASQLLDTVSAFLSDFEMIETRMIALSRSYSDAKNRLFESNQSVVARTRRLVEAGARGKKQLHESLKSSDDEVGDVVPRLDLSAEPED